MVQCPTCKDYDVRSSRWTSVFERILLGAILRQPVRCYTCFRRFHVSSFATVKPRGPHGSRDRAKLALTPVETREENRHDEIRASAKAS